MVCTDPQYIVMCNTIQESIILPHLIPLFLANLGTPATFLNIQRWGYAAPKMLDFASASLDGGSNPSILDGQCASINGENIALTANKMAQ